MATSTGKTAALILLVALILLLAWRLTPLIVAPFGIFSSVTNVLRVPGVHEIDFGPRFIRLTSLTLMSLLLLVIWIVVIVWVYRDAERRGMNGVLWALLVLIGNLIGLLIYLIVRSDIAFASQSRQATKTCPGCQKPVSATFAFCPHCGTRLQNVCPGCGKPIEETWKVCPHCGEKMKK